MTGEICFTWQLLETWAGFESKYKNTDFPQLVTDYEKKYQDCRKNITLVKYLNQRNIPIY